MKVIIALIALVVLSSCGHRITEAQWVVDRADQILAELQDREQQALLVLDAAERLANTIGGEEAAAAVQDARAVVAAIQEQIPGARDHLERAQEGLEVARQTMGIGVMDIAIMLISLGIGIGPALWQAVRARRWLEVARHLAHISQQFKHRAEEQQVDVGDIITKAKRDQEVMNIERDVHRVLYED